MHDVEEYLFLRHISKSIRGVEVFTRCVDIFMFNVFNMMKKILKGSLIEQEV